MLYVKVGLITPVPGLGRIWRRAVCRKVDNISNMPIPVSKLPNHAVKALLASLDSSILKSSPVPQIVSFSAQVMRISDSNLKRQSKVSL